MPRACDLKKGNVVDINGDIYMVKHIDVRTPSARGAVTLYKVRFTHIKTKQKFESSYKGNDILEDVALSRKPVQYLYPDGECHVFMDTLEYAQHLIAGDTIEDLTGLFVEGNLVALEIPASLVFEIEETAPGIKGASATARTKPATLSNGVEIQVPEYLEPGEKVRVNTETRKFMSRA
jgi:elongation factor P